MEPATHVRVQHGKYAVPILPWSIRRNSPSCICAVNYSYLVPVLVLTKLYVNYFLVFLQFIVIILSLSPVF